MSAYDTAVSAILGNPYDPNKTPSREGTVQAFFEFDAALSSIAYSDLGSGTYELFATRAIMYADITPAAGVLGFVYDDDIDDYNGVYLKSGGPGTGGWITTNILLTSSIRKSIIALQASVLALQNGDLGKAAADIPSANQMNITSILGDYAQVTGSETIQYFTAARIGLERSLIFMSSLTLLHSDFIRLPGNANIVVQAGDRLNFRCVAENRWTCMFYQRANGKPVVRLSVDDIDGISDVVADVIALRDQTITASNAAAISATNADTSYDLSAGIYNDMLSFVSSGLQLILDDVGDGATVIFDLLHDLPATNGYMFANVFVDGKHLPKDGVSYSIITGGTQIEFDVAPGNLLKVTAEKALVLEPVSISGSFPSIRNHGAIGGGTDDTVAIDATLSDEGEAYIPKGKFTVNDSFQNRSGAKIYGPGSIIVPTDDGERQLNTYSDDGKYIRGLEYLSSYFAKIIAKDPIKIVFSGDSTTQGADFENTIPHLMWDNGIRNISIYNRGFSGETLLWWQENRMGVDINDPDTYGIPDLLCHRWGINDPADGRSLADMEETLWSSLETIRGVSDHTELPILICTPNAAVLDPERNEAWNEGLYGIYREAARYYKCAFMDIYGYLRDMRVDGWSNSNDHIHPNEAGRATILNLYADALIPRGLASVASGNSLWNLSGSEPGYVNTNAAAPPSDYKEGMTWSRAQDPSNNWPIDGKLQTLIGRDGLGSQTLTSWFEPYMIEWKRAPTQSGVNGDHYTDWTEWVQTIGKIPRAALTYGPNWSRFDPVGQLYDAVTVFKNANGLVFLNGMVTLAVAQTANMIIAYAPAGFRPSKRKMYSVATDAGGQCNVQVYPNGEIRLYGGTYVGFLSLDGIFYEAAF